MKRFLGHLFLCLVFAACSSTNDTGSNSTEEDSGNNTSPDQTVAPNPDTGTAQADPGTPPIDEPDFGDDCATNSDCRSGFCVPTPTGNVCSELCEDTCPEEGYTCVETTIAGNATSDVCLSDDANLCRPCIKTSDCLDMGGDLNAQCVLLSEEEGSYCATDCSDGKGCNEGYSCNTIDGADLCTPDADVCECNEWAIEAKALTECGVGECFGERNCEHGGLTACNGPSPVAETCDSLDNDCNGAVDEELGSTSCGQGQCTHSYQNCIDGEVQVCNSVLGATDELCDGIDNNCDGIIDNDFTDLDGDLLADCVDDDDDGDGDLDETDCAPLDASIHSNVIEACDDIDNNCNGETDENDALGCMMLYEDLDVDGYGGDGPACLCAANEEWNAEVGGDCDDLDDQMYPGYEEVCDGKDNDCQDGADDALVVPCVPDGYTGDEAFWSVGICGSGTSTCLEGVWDSCEGFIAPSPDICDDALDNDCNGAIDDASTCAENCVGDECDFTAGGGGDGEGEEGGTEFNEPTPPDPENPEETVVCEFDCGYNVGVNDDGHLYLDLTVSVIDVPYIWVANSNDNTISKHHSVTKQEIARYRVDPGCANPSRTAVNDVGGVWVACREGNHVVHIAPDEAHCIDKNNNGIVDTASVVYNEDGSKTVNLLPPDDDDCVLFHGVPANASDATSDAQNNPIPPVGECEVGFRGIAVRADNSVQMGSYTDCRSGHTWQGEYRYDPELPYQQDINPTLVVIDHWYIPGLDHQDWNGDSCGFDGSYTNRAYGYAIDQSGHMWVSSIDTHIAWVDLDNRRSCSFPTATTYGVAVDYAGRVWYGDWSGGSQIGHVFDPSTKTMHSISQMMDGQNFWDVTNLPSSQYTRGAGASFNPEEPFGYFSMSNGAFGPVKIQVTSESPFEAKIKGITRLDSNGVCAGAGSGCGISLDGAGDLWVVGMDICGTSTYDGKSHDHSVSVELDPELIDGWNNPSNASEAQALLTGMVGQGSYTYTYSDFMGFAYATIVNPTGFYVQRFEGWGVEDETVTTLWKKVVVEIEETDSFPPLQVSYRAGDSAEALGALDFTAPESVSCTDGTCIFNMPAEVIGSIADVKLTISKDSEGGTLTIESISVTGAKLGL